MVIQKLLKGTHPPIRNITMLSKMVIQKLLKGTHPPEFIS